MTCKNCARAENIPLVVFKPSYSTYEDQQLMKKRLLMHVLTILLILNCDIQYFSLWILKNVSLHILLIIVTLLKLIKRNFCL